MTKQIQIRPVRNKAEEHAFLDLPTALFRDDDHYIPPLLFERKQALSKKHPYFDHAQWQAWIAWEGPTPIGRISAQIDQLAQQRQQRPVGHFGFFDAPDRPAVARELFAAAENWLHQQGATTAVGPFNLSVNQELGLLVEGFDSPAFFLMPQSQPHYAGLVEGCGYEPVQDLLALLLEPDFAAPPIMTKLLQRQSSNVTTRPLNRRRLQSELSLLRDIFNDAWQDNWGFVPFTEDEFQALGKELVLWVPEDCVQIAAVDGVPAAFIVLVPNVNEAIADLNGRLWPLGWAKFLWRMKVRFPTTARVPLMGVRKSFQQTRLGPGLAFRVIDAVRHNAVARGVKLCEMSWILESNQGMRSVLDAIGGRISKRYRMYAKTL